MAGNDRFDAERVKELGARKSRAHIRFDELGQPISPAVENTSVPGVASADIEYLGVTKPLTERRLKRQERRDERQKVKDMKKSANAAKRARRGEVAQPNQSAEGVPFEEAKDVQMDG